MDRKTTIGLVVICALLALYVLIVQKPQEGASADATATAAAGQDVPLWDFALDQVTGVRLDDYATVRTVAFEKDARGSWKVTQPSEGPADTVLAERIIGDLRRLYVLSEIPGVTDLASYGLDKPLYGVRLKLADGTSLEATIGAKTLTGSGYYVLPRGEAKARVVGYIQVGDAVITPLGAPPYFVPTAVPTAAEQPTVDLSRILPGTATGAPPESTPTPAATPQS
jgi:hypothetical protein